MHSRAMEFAKNYRVPLHVRTSFSEAEGTIICEEVPEMEDVVVRGAALTKNEAKVTIRGVDDRPGVAATILESLAKGDINVDMIVQNVSEGSTTDFTFTVPELDLDEALQIIQSIKDEIGADKITSDRNIGKVSVVGVGMRSHSGVASTMFRALAEAGINIELISTSEIKISVVVDRKDADRALRVVHKAFHLDELKRKKS
jgi:aspartate kinase